MSLPSSRFGMAAGALGRLDESHRSSVMCATAAATHQPVSEGPLASCRQPSWCRTASFGWAGILASLAARAKWRLVPTCSSCRRKRAGSGATCQSAPSAGDRRPPVWRARTAWRPRQPHPIACLWLDAWNSLSGLGAWYLRYQWRWSGCHRLLGDAWRPARSDRAALLPGARRGRA